MNDTKKVDIHQYEIGRQKNYDILDFYLSLRNNDDELEAKEYHHSLFYPILYFCIEIINSTDDLDKIKYKVGLDKDGRIYVTVGREMNDLFFMEDSGNLDNKEIEFDSGKENYLLTSVHHNDDMMIMKKVIFKNFIN